MSRKKRRAIKERVQNEIKNGISQHSEEEDLELDELFKVESFEDKESKEFPFLNAIWKNEFELINSDSTDFSKEETEEFIEIYEDILEDLVSNCQIVVDSLPSSVKVKSVEEIKEEVRKWIEDKGLALQMNAESGNKERSSLDYKITSDKEAIQIQKYKGVKYWVDEPQYRRIIDDEDDFKFILACSFRLNKDQPAKSILGVQEYLHIHGEQLEHFKDEKDLFEDTLRLYKHIIPKKGVYALERHLSFEAEEKVNFSAGDEKLLSDLDAFLMECKFIDQDFNWNLFSEYHKKKSRINPVAGLVGLLTESKLLFEDRNKSIASIGDILGKRYKLCSDELTSLKNALKTKKLENNFFYKEPDKDKMTFDKPRDFFIDFIEKAKKDKRKYK